MLHVNCDFTSVLSCRYKSVRRGQVQLLPAVRHRPLRHHQLRMRPRMRADHEAGVCPRRRHLHVHVRAEAAGVQDEEQHRGRLRRHVRFQRALLGEGQWWRPRVAVHESSQGTRGTREHDRGFRFRSPRDCSRIGVSRCAWRIVALRRMSRSWCNVDRGTIV